MKRILTEEQYRELEAVLQTKQSERFTGVVTLTMNFKDGGVGSLGVNEARQIAAKKRQWREG